MANPRPNRIAGRPAGIPNRATFDKERQIAASGLTPLDFLLSVVRDRDAKRSERLFAAKEAAPFCHPRLTSVDVNVINHRATVADIDARIREWIAAYGKGRVGPAAGDADEGGKHIEGVAVAHDEGREE